MDKSEYLLLREPPQKDGIETKYSCGLRFTGSWATRNLMYETFLASPVGKYIQDLEDQVENFDKEKSIQQLIGFEHSSSGFDIISLVEAMGLTYEEWHEIKKDVSLHVTRYNELETYFLHKDIY